LSHIISITDNKTHVQGSGVKKRGKSAAFIDLEPLLKGCLMGAFYGLNWAILAKSFQAEKIFYDKKPHGRL
jgi:hypothetical protein